LDRATAFAGGARLASEFHSVVLGFSLPLHGGATQGFLALFRYTTPNLEGDEPAADL
jgi:hypothetical protein